MLLPLFVQPAHLSYCFFIASVQESMYRVSIHVKDRELMDKIAALNEGQRKIIEHEILLLLSEDVEEPGELTSLKHTAYIMYANDIAHLIAELEVHFHDLPVWIYGFIEMIFRLSSQAAIEDEITAKELYMSVISYEHFLINYINLELIDYYFKEIKQYKKTLIRFKHSAVKIDDGTPVITALNTCLKEIEKLKKKCRKIFKKCYAFNKKVGLLRFKTNDTESQYIPELAECIQQAKTGVALCEKYYPVIINKTFVSTYRARIAYELPSIISFFLAVAGIVLFILKQTG